MKHHSQFTYFHTHVITQSILESAVQSGRSLEMDVSVNQNDELYVGHPESFYKFKDLPLPKNVALEEVIAAVYKQGSMYLVIDCKDVRAIPRIAEIINQFGSHRVVFHSWVDTLLFKPYPPEITIEPHWPYEDLPVSVVKDLHHQTGVTTICSARGLTPHRLATEVDEITQHMISTVGSFATAINWNLPGGQAPPMAAMNTLLAHGIRTFINIDVVPSAFRPAKYIGMTDNIALSSRP